MKNYLLNLLILFLLPVLLYSSTGEVQYGLVTRDGPETYLTPGPDGSVTGQLSFPGGSRVFRLRDR